MTTWKQRDGTEIEISQMTDKHLENTISMIERSMYARLEVVRWQKAAQIFTYAAEAPDGAAMAAEEEADRILNGEMDEELIQKSFPKLDLLYAEQRKRKEDASTPDTEDRLAIVTTFVYLPIPDRCFDWSATLGDYDIGSKVGWGATEAEAIADLREVLGEYEEVSA